MDTRRSNMTKKKQPDIKATRDKILEAAEHLFGEHGYDATSIRDIANLAEVKLGLVSYYFASKEALYDCLIERRAAEIGRRRLALLAQENRSVAPAPIPTERIIYAYVWPFLELACSAGPEWKSYTSIISSVANSKRWSGLISSYYDPVARTFLTELRRALPGCSQAELSNAFVFTVSVMLGAAAETGRVGQLSDGQVQADDIEHIFDVMLPFLAGGFHALAQRAKLGQETSSEAPVRQPGEGSGI
ncbi:TetR/AcrR family transcriptional regulator [Methylobacterium aquaticum]|uniref:TetR/AcrR family transcriptional regulator n=1 Tax=Methylobacterium aquaticum TaxID=270351 RepID=UPI003D17F505